MDPNQDLEDLGLPGLYDGDFSEPEEPWYLPPTPDPLLWPGERRSEGTGPTLVVSAWVAAQEKVAAELAHAASAVAMLDTRLRYGRPGWHGRIVQKAVADLSWHQVGRISEDRLALYTQGVLSAPSDPDEARSLRLLGWAARRWQRPLARGDVAAFLGEEAETTVLDGRFVARDRAGFAAPAERAGEGTDFSVFEQMIEDADELHPLLRTAYAMAAWSRLELAYERAPVQGMVLASVIGAADLRGGLRFLPMSLGGGALGFTGDSLEARCRACLRAVEQGALRGLMEVDRVEAWRERALTNGRGGKSLPRIIDALAAEPAVSANRIIETTGLSRATAQNILRALEGQGVIREMTGNDRYRVFTIAHG